MIRSGYKLGDWLAKCDRCADVKYASQLKKEWTGYRVCDRCWEPRHPQEFLKGHADDSNVAWTRPDTTPDTVVTTVDGETLVSNNDPLETVGDASKTLVVDTNAAIQHWNTELTADRTATLSTTGAQKGDRFVIYKTEADDYSLYIK